MLSRLGLSCFAVRSSLQSVVADTGKRLFSLSIICNTRTEWSKTRPRRNLPSMDLLPRYLIDGGKRRNRWRSGRDETGRISVRHKGGGHKQNYRNVDLVRIPISEETNNATEQVIDKVYQIGYDPCRSGHVALVAGNQSRKLKLIVAPHGIEVGDVLTASRGPPASLARLKTGDAHPIGTLPIGATVHNIELVPGGGAHFARAAGTSVTILRKQKDGVVVRLPSKTEKLINEQCLATIGRVSNIEKKHEVIGKAGRNRWLGRRPKGQTGKDRWLWTKKVR